MKARKNILIPFECWGYVRDSFIKQGHNAVSCDILPTRRPGPHIQANAFDVMYDRKWDMMIAFYPCWALTGAGSRWFYEKRAEQYRAVQEFKQIMDAPIDEIGSENPIGVLSTKYRKPDQIVQPWMFGHLESKATCLWLKGLPKLAPTFNVYNLMMCLPKRERNRVHHMAPGPDRSELRSITYFGVANAMATQWS